eukprot:4080739-Pyramimonas_sp.AAC.1
MKETIPRYSITPLTSSQRMPPRRSGLTFSTHSNDFRTHPSTPAATHAKNQERREEEIFHLSDQMDM